MGAQVYILHEKVRAQSLALDTLREQMRSTDVELTSVHATLDQGEDREIGFESRVDHRLRDLEFEYSRFNTSVSNKDVVDRLAEVIPV